MAHAACQQKRPRRAMVLALLATTAMASMLGACNQSNRLFSRGPADDVKMSASEAATATSKWAMAYAKNPQDPDNALGYAKALRALGSKDRSLEVLKTAYRADPSNGEVAAELGRVALETGQTDTATHALKSAASQGVTDWKTLSAQGTLAAKSGNHAEAQQYFQAALQKNPDSMSVINNLALSYALDGKAKESEDLLRKAVASGHEDKRVRQNLALVLGLQGKFDEARQVASVDMTEAQAKSSMSYLRNMLNSPTKVASAAPTGSAQASAEDWSPFGPEMAANEPAPVRTASAAATAAAANAAKVQMVKPVDQIEPPKVKTAQNNAAKPAKPGAATTSSPAPAASQAPGAPTQIMPASLLRADVD